MSGAGPAMSGAGPGAGRPALPSAPGSGGEGRGPCGAGAAVVRSAPDRVAVRGRLRADGPLACGGPGRSATGQWPTQPNSPAGTACCVRRAAVSRSPGERRACGLRRPLRARGPRRRAVPTCARGRRAPRRTGGVVCSRPAAGLAGRALDRRGADGRRRTGCSAGSRCPGGGVCRRGPGSLVPYLGVPVGHSAPTGTGRRSGRPACENGWVRQSNPSGRVSSSLTAHPRVSLSQGAASPTG